MMSAAIVESSSVPPKGRLKRILWAAGGLMALGLLGEFTDGYFIPERATMIWGLILAAGLALPVLLFCFHILHVFSKKPDATFGIMALLLLVTVCAVVCILIFGSIGLSYGLSNIYTEIEGQPAIREVSVIRWRPRQHHRRSLDTCAGIDIRATNNPFVGIEHLCFPRQVAPGTRLTLHGRQSALGFHLDTIN
jgi:hypothetical protein